MAMQIYGDRVSGNCLKVKWTADKLGLAYVWIQTDVLQAQSRTPQFLALNPAGQVPTVVLEDGRPLAQSNAIILHLAQGSDLIPADAYDRARMLEWMFWEQYSHEPYIAVARFQRLLLGRPADQIEPRLMERGHAALARMALQLDRTPFLVGAAPVRQEAHQPAHDEAADHIHRQGAVGQARAQELEGQRPDQITGHRAEAAAGEYEQ